MPFWKPNLATLGLNEASLPADYGWVTLANSDARLPAQVPAVIPGKIRITRHTTSLALSTVHYFHSHLFLVVPPMGCNVTWSEIGCTTAENVVTIAKAPKEWLLGPNAHAFLLFVAKIAQLQDAFWDVLESPAQVQRAAVQALMQPLPAWAEMAFDKDMARTRREGAVVSALNYTEEEIYGWRVSALGRDGNLAYISDKSWLLNCVVPSARNSVTAVDNAIRWLLLRDVLPKATFQLVAEPWHQVFGWGLSKE